MFEIYYIQIFEVRNIVIFEHWLTAFFEMSLLHS